jgi:hypothetical protein
MDILRFITAGSVDDGKSTLIGRLLYDSKSIMIDQLEAIGGRQRTAKKVILTWPCSQTGCARNVNRALLSMWHINIFLRPNENSL